MRKRTRASLIIKKAFQIYKRSKKCKIMQKRSKRMLKRKQSELINKCSIIVRLLVLVFFHKVVVLGSVDRLLVGLYRLFFLVLLLQEFVQRQLSARHCRTFLVELRPWNCEVPFCILAPIRLVALASFSIFAVVLILVRIVIRKVVLFVGVLRLI